MISTENINIEDKNLVFTMKVDINKYNEIKESRGRACGYNWDSTQFIIGEEVMRELDRYLASHYYGEKHNKLK